MKKTQSLFIAAAVGLAVSATVTMAQFDMFRPPMQDGGQQSSQGQNFQSDGQNFQKDGQNFQKDGQNFINNRNQFQGDQGQRQDFGDKKRPEGLPQDQFRDQKQMNSREFQDDRRGNQGENFDNQNKRPEDTRSSGNGNCNSQEECDQMQKQADESRVKEEQRMDERRFQDMKRGMKQFENGLKMTQNMVKKIKPRLDKCGIGMPLELTQALDLAPGVVSKLNAAKTADELEDIMGDIMDVGEAMREWGPKTGDLSQLCDMLKRSDKEFKNMTRDVEKLSKRVTSNKKIDLSELLAELKSQAAKMSEAWSEAKKIAKTDPEAAFEKLDEGFYGEMDAMQNIRRTVETVLDVSRGLRDAKNEVAKYSREIAKLKKKKIDTAEMQVLFGEFKAKVDEIALFVKTKGFDPDDLVDKVEEAFDIRGELQDMLGEYGVNQVEPQFKGEQGFKFQLPQGFERQSVGGGQQQDGQEVE